jgi:hypothetical protein
VCANDPAALSSNIASGIAFLLDTTIAEPNYTIRQKVRKPEQSAPAFSLLFIRRD